MLLAAEFESLNTQNVCGHIKITISYVVRETAGSFMGSTLALSCRLLLAMWSEKQQGVLWDLP